MERVIASVAEKLDGYDFAHAVQEAYGFFWSELCDWYLEIAKPRLYEGEAEVSAHLLWLLERTLALLHPIMPFVTEEIWSYHPSREGHLAVHRFPEPDEGLRDEEAEAEVERGIELTRRLRAWRDMVEAPASAVLSGLIDDPAQEFVGRLSRFELASAIVGDNGTAIASVGPVQVLASAAIDAEAVAARLESRREELRSEVARAEDKLANEKFVARAPAELVSEERAKLARYRAELEELTE
jgi:valyl-tRNA synthetase